MTLPLDIMIEAALEAGRDILSVYATDFDATLKGDNSPVTIADERAEAIILRHLAVTGLPVLAEESAAAGHIPELGDRYFIVDPLDGTKEFIKKNGEFTVNIALVENGKPVAGVVSAPALGKLYAGSPDGAFKAAITETGLGSREPIAVRKDAPLNVVASRSHGHAALGFICDELKVAGDVSVGSSLKFCLVAEGAARLYPRLTPTCEWDTAAGQAVLEAAGGTVVTKTGEPLTYGKSENDFLNPFFIAADDPYLAADCARIMREALND
ncbi:3'(2'),5'-bisphosphate nucleotidase CysQ [Cucumibacter marinus]|uniref:3'(2'),5'-bisphosphate nucleotidase CysQ n=1 Tax=Cucumibacter marinus TaxID=1121252 RepID=UPI0004193CBA|nr:3'(2'),5'-bisphosphate nucleotidase CysQ [Cucumibacter marinus]